MENGPNTVEIRFNRRNWIVSVHEAGADFLDLEGVSDALAQGADLALLGSVDDNLHRRWHQACTSRGGYEAWLIPGIGGPTLGIGPAAPYLIVGPPRILRRFLDEASVRPDRTAPATTLDGVPEGGNSTGRDGDDVLRGRYPDLPDPADVPRFQEEGCLDPFGQHPGVLGAAWARLARVAGDTLKCAHDNRLAMTLPPPAPGAWDPALRPWRAAVVLSEEADPERDVETARRMLMESGDLADEVDFGLEFTQRYLVTLVALSSALGPEGAVWCAAAEALEDVGYLLLTRSLRLEGIEGVAFYYSVGELAAKLHSHNYLHGDMHPDNFLVNPESNTTVIGDVGTLCLLNRAPKPIERARDLALLKTQCHFYAWEAVKRGYRNASGPEAERVFELL